MELSSARALGRRLMSEHGLAEWELVFDNAKTRAGVCRHGARQIGLSRELTRLHSEPQVTDTLLHEIAHALAGARAGHGERWRAVARGIGCSATRCVPDDAPRLAAPWTGTCPAGHSASRHRRPDRVLSCRRCARGFSADAVFEWRFQGRVVAMSPAYVAELARVRSAVVSAAGEEGATATVPARAVPVGARVRLGGTGRFAGLTGTVEKRGRSRYHVRTARGLLTAPFPLVEPLDDVRAARPGARERGARGRAGRPAGQGPWTSEAV